MNGNALVANNENTTLALTTATTNSNADFGLETAEGTYTVTLSAATNGNLAPIYLPYAVTLPAGVEAYQVVSNDRSMCASRPSARRSFPPSLPYCSKAM